MEHEWGGEAVMGEDGGRCAGGLVCGGRFWGEMGGWGLTTNGEGGMGRGGLV